LQTDQTKGGERKWASIAAQGNSKGIEQVREAEGVSEGEPPTKKPPKKLLLTRLEDERGRPKRGPKQKHQEVLQFKVVPRNLGSKGSLLLWKQETGVLEQNGHTEKENAKGEGRITKDARIWGPRIMRKAGYAFLLGEEAKRLQSEGSH